MSKLLFKFLTRSLWFLFFSRSSNTNRAIRGSRTSSTNYYKQRNFFFDFFFLDTLFVRADCVRWNILVRARFFFFFSPCLRQHGRRRRDEPFGVNRIFFRFVNGFFSFVFSPFSLPALYKEDNSVVSVVLRAFVIFISSRFGIIYFTALPRASPYTNTTRVCWFFSILFCFLYPYCYNYV